MKIWKFPLGKVATNEIVAITMPAGAKVLHVGTQKNVLCIWALIDLTSTGTETRHFYVAATGETVPKGQYLGTVFQHDGVYVWHIFEVKS